MISFIQSLFISLTVILIISLIIPTLSYILSEKNPDKDKSSVYECGFNPINNIGHPFSIKFFIVAILFLVFDLEVILIFPWTITIYFLSKTGNTVFLIFFIILALGLYYEWVNGGLDWDKWYN